MPAIPSTLEGLAVRYPKPLLHYVETALKDDPKRTRAEVLAPADGYQVSCAELKQAFDMIADRADWRAPIRALIPSEWERVCAMACVFYTATFLDFTPAAPGFVIVTAPGYRAGPAGP